MSTVVSLCDITGNFVRPWVEAGYDAVLVDPQHGSSSIEPLPAGNVITRIAATVEEALPELGDLLRYDEIAFVAGWPPCTDMAISGARWFAEKYRTDPLFQAKAVAVAEQCRTFARTSGAPWIIENPVGVLSRVFGRPDHYFHPHQFTAYEASDNYNKKTCLWSGGGFEMPMNAVAIGLGDPDNRIHFAAPGAQRANVRSATPMGFARAVFAANAKVIEVAA